MDQILEFILARYSYWVVIILMLSGLYIVMVRGNLIKTLVGLNLFQTAVFIFYISVGKVAGGTAPIYLDMYALQKHTDTPYSTEMAHEMPPVSAADDTDHPLLEQQPAADQSAYDVPSNSLDMVDLPDTLVGDGKTANLHALPPGESPNKLPDIARDVDTPPTHKGGAGELPAEKGHAPRAGQHYEAAPVMYSNPLPHVLILTAIVVGVATTAVGLSLIIRIRAAYGSIEADDIEKADWEVEVGANTPGMVRNFATKGVVRDH